MKQRIEKIIRSEMDLLPLRAAQLHAEKGEFAAALTLVEDLRKAFPHCIELILYAGILQRLCTNFTDSNALFEQALLTNEQDVDAWEGILLNALLQEDRAQRKSLLDRLHMKHHWLEQQPSLLAHMGTLQLVLGNPLLALKTVQKALENSPQHPLLLYSLGQIHIALGHTKEMQSVIDDLQKSHTAMAQELTQAQLVEPGKRATPITFADRVLVISPMHMAVPREPKLSQSRVTLSIVVPIMNEEDNLPILFEEITEVLDTLQQEYEIIFVDDGSTDASRDILKALAFVDARVRVVLFRRNYGQTAALSAGFKQCRGNVVITMDGDLQNDPKDIPLLLQKMSEGYDLVSGWRKNRQDTLITRKIPSLIANKLINHLISGTGVQLHDFGCTLKAYKSEIVKNIHLYGEMHRFIPVFAAWLGVKVTEIAVNHRPRVHGYAKYGLSRVQRVIFDLIVVRFFSDYMTRPIQFFGKIAKLAMQCGLSVLVLLGVLSYSQILPLQADTFLILGSLLVLGCLQMLIMGLTGELLIRSYFEMQNKDHYVIESILNE